MTSSLDLNEAVKQQIAADIIKSLPAEARERIFQEAIAETISDYEFKNAMDDAVLNLCKEQMAEYLKQPEVRERLRLASIAAIDKFITVVPIALMKVLVEAATGRRDFQSRPTDFTRAVEQFFGIPEEKSSR